MKKLNDIYNEENFGIRRKVEFLEDTSEIIEIVQRELRQLSDIKGEYMGNLTKSQARIALSMLEAFRSSFIMLKKGQRPISRSYQHVMDANCNSSEEGNSSQESWFIDVACAGIGGLSGSFLGGAPGAALGAVSGTAFSSVLKRTKGTSKQPSQATVEPEPSIRKVNLDQAETTLEAKELISYLEQGLDIIDQTVTEYGRISKPVIHKPQIEEHPEVLKFIQDFMGEIQSFEKELPPIFQSRLREVSSILRKYGIQSQNYNEDASDDIKTLFEYETSFDDTLKKHIMLTPALLKDGKLLLAGRVLEPSLK